MTNEPASLPRGRRRARHAAAPLGTVCLTFALLAGTAFETQRRGTVDGIPEYHARIAAEAGRAFPDRIGEWIGREVPTPPSAISLLRPNALRSRGYFNPATRESVSVLFVHCGDARDLRGHYPPACYPANGKTLDSESVRDWSFGSKTIHGKRYRFSASDLAGDRAFVVDNFMILPNGTFGRDMASVTEIAADRRLRQLGAAEVQVVTDPSVSEERRDEILGTLLGQAGELFACVERGIPQ